MCLPAAHSRLASSRSERSDTRTQFFIKEKTMKKITLEEHFLSPAYAQHVRDLQSQSTASAGVSGMPPEFAAMLADPLIQRGIAAVEAKLLDVGEGRLAAMDASGIDLQVLSLSALTFAPIQGERDTAQAIS